MDILKTVTDRLEKKIREASFEGANIVLYTDNEKFFKDGEAEIKKIVNDIKKRIELRADEKLLLSKEDAEKEIRKIVPSEAEITNIIFDVQRSVVIIEAKKPGLVIGKMGSILNEIKRATFWSPQVQRSPAISSKIVENIREVLYENNNYRRRFLNSIGEKIYKEWNPEKTDEWVRLTFLGSARQVGRSCLLLTTPNSRILLDCGIDVSSQGEDKYPYFNIPEFDLNQLDAVVLSHAHVDHSAFVPYLYKMGFRGPTYCTAPTRDVAALLALDYIGVAFKQAKKSLFDIEDVKNAVLHTITLGWEEVADITPDVRATLYNSGHILGSSMIHLNIGNGLHNIVYSGDMKYLRTQLLEPAHTRFPRVETLVLESTYGAKTDVLASRREAEKNMVIKIKETFARGG